MIKKIVIGFMVFILLLAALLIIVPLTFKAQINNWVKQQINTGINAKVDYANICITCFKNFPDVDVSVNQITVTGDSLLKGDTLALIDDFNITIDIHSLLSGSNYKVLQCSINHPVLRLRKDSAGHTNFNILREFNLAQGQTVVAANDTGSVNLQINHYKIDRAEVVYADVQSKFEMHLPDLNMEGSIHSGIIQSTIQTADLGLVKEGKEYCDHAKLNAAIHYSLTGDTLLLDSVTATLGKNDLHGTGFFTHVLGAKTQQTPFTASLNLKSRVFDLNNQMQNAFTSKPSPAVGSVKMPPATNTLKSDKMPADNTIAPAICANISFDTLYLGKLLLQQVQAQISTGKDSLLITGFNCNLLGGSATAVLTLAHQRDIQFQFSLMHCDIQQTCSAVPVTDKIAPVARYMKGSFSAGLKASALLNNAATIDYNTLAGDARIEMGKIKVTQIPALSNLGKLAQNANLDNLEMAPTISVIHCKNNTVTVEPTDVKFTNGFELNIKGNNTFDGVINYDMRLNVPTKQMGGIASLAQSFLSGIPGLNIKVPDVMIFSFNVTGTFDKPQAKLLNVGTGN